MSSALQSAQSPSSSKQWWSRSSKSSTVSYRPSRIPSSSSSSQLPTKPTSRLDEKQTMSRASQKPATLKFNTLVSAIGFKSKKNSAAIDIPPGPSSPPLPFQNPPPSSPPRLQTSSSSSSFYNGAKSPIEPSIYTVHSLEDSSEPPTPSDASRHRISYQPSLFTYAEQEHIDLGRSENLAIRYVPVDSRRVSVMSDPSIIDPQMKRNESGFRYSRLSSLSANQTSAGHNSQTNANNHTRSLNGNTDRRQSLSGDRDVRSSHLPSATRRKSPDLAQQDRRLSDSAAKPLNKVSSPVTTSVSGKSHLKRSSPNLGLSKMQGKPSLSSLRSSEPSSSRSGSRSDQRDSRETRSPILPSEEKKFEDQMKGEKRNSNLDENCPVQHLSVSRQAQSLSPRSRSASTSGSSSSQRPTPTLNMSFNSTMRGSVSTASLAEVSSLASGSIRRQGSRSLMRPIPPSITPPPTDALPPTPGSASASGSRPPSRPASRPPSPVVFRSPRSPSSGSIFGSSFSVTSGDDRTSTVIFDVPPTPSSISTENLIFAHPNNTDPNLTRKTNGSLRMGLRDLRNSPLGAAHSRPGSREEFGSVPRSSTSASSQAHGSKSSMSSSSTQTATGRGGTPTPRALKKSASQTSMSVSSIFGNSGTRPRVDSETSAASFSVFSDEGSSPFGSAIAKSLRKQRSLHNARAPSGMLVPPLPQQLRHASSFGASTQDSIKGGFGSGQGPANSRRPATSNLALSSSSGTNSNLSSTVTTPTTPPQTQRRRALFSSHGSHRDRRDSNQKGSERERDEVRNMARFSDHSLSRKSVSRGLPFTNPFSPENRNVILPVQRASEPPIPSSVQDSVLQRSDTQSPEQQSPKLVDMHILPPAELLSKIEALADRGEPSSPLQFASTCSDDVDGDWSLDAGSIAEKQSIRSQLESISGFSLSRASDADSLKSSPASPTTIPRHFGAQGLSISSRLHNDRPSTASRLPTRTSSLLSRDTVSSRMRPSTAQPSDHSNRGIDGDSLHVATDERNSHGRPVSGSDFIPTALPPPPRRTIGTPRASQFVDDGIVNPLSPPPPRQAPASSYLLQRHSSHDTIESTYNPNRGSIFRKPSFLNIDDDMVEPQVLAVKSIPSVPEDSFLILEHGKDSLDICRSSEEDFVDQRYGVLL